MLHKLPIIPEVTPSKSVSLELFKVCGAPWSEWLTEAEKTSNRWVEGYLSRSGQTEVNRAAEDEIVLQGVAHSREGWSAKFTGGRTACERYGLAIRLFCPWGDRGQREQNAKALQTKDEDHVGFKKNT